MRRTFSPVLATCTIALTLALAACGGGGGASAVPQPLGASSSQNGVTPAAPASNTVVKTPTPPPTPTPVPLPTAAPSQLPYVPDTDPSTAGVFLGAVCGQNAVMTCQNFPVAFRHPIALGTMYSDWSADLGRVIQNQGIASWVAQGITPEITWQPPTTIKLSDVNSGAYDAYFTTTANELKQFGSTVFLRPFHEFNGAWYPWGLPNQGAGPQADTDFIAAWQRMVNIFHQQGATNVKFVWCYSAGILNNVTKYPWDSPAAAYPGDAYVDWISFDAYNRASLAMGGRWRSFDQTIGQAYQMAVSISPNKPVSVSELASNEYGDGGSAKTMWVTQMLEELASQSNPYPNLKLFSWFESDTKGYSYDLQSTNPVYLAFANGVRLTDALGRPAFRGNNAALANIVAAP